ncbi:MAG: phosphatase PAP2 family protein [Candidatus Cloacimonadaceae bacterium]|jgi:membrane-associated PAP2 superfamily phosphatase|nr:phosphatase PAP2 family protein [Candidatus Syntrophosphaera sp.]NLN85140.1 phosphatase PAP2 family protein [Candidatus Cloacimonadota bacterium]
MSLKKFPRDPVSQTMDMAVPRSRHILFALDFILPILILALGTWLIRSQGLDLKYQSHFYRGNGIWMGNKAWGFEFIYKYGTLPSLIVALAGVAVFVTSFFSKNLARWRRSGLFLALAMLLGPMLLVNAILKENWGRPRPSQVIEFGGIYAYEPPLSIDHSSPGKSFPSGHASMTFYFFALYFIFRGRKKRLAAWSLVFSLVFGFGMGLVRMAQGGHFISDILWAGGVVWLSCALLYYLLKLDRLAWKPRAQPKNAISENTAQSS